MSEFWDGTLWVCVDCLIAREGDLDEAPDREPWGLIGDDVTVAHGLDDDEHGCGMPWPERAESDECDCERQQFAMSACGACGSTLGGTREAYSYRLARVEIDRDARRGFWRGYRSALIWTGLAVSADDDGTGETMDQLDSFGADDDELWSMVDPASRAEAIRDCLSFLRRMADHLPASKWNVYARVTEDAAQGRWAAWEQAGHDFCLTRQGQGAGFWDRGADAAGEILTAWAKDAGNQQLTGTYAGDTVTHVYLEG